MQFDNIETVKRAVEIDSGVAIVPQETISEEVANQTLAAVELENGAYSRPLAIIYKKNKVLSPAIKQFIAHAQRAGLSRRPALAVALNPGRRRRRRRPPASHHSLSDPPSSPGCRRPASPVCGSGSGSCRRKIVVGELSTLVLPRMYSTRRNRTRAVAGGRLPNALTAQVQLHHRPQVQRRVQERRDLGLPTHSLQGLCHLREEDRVRPPFPKLFQLAERIAIDDVGRIKGLLLPLVEQRQRIPMQRPDPRINDLVPGVEAAVLAPQIMVDSLDGVVIARAQRARAEAQQLPRQQARPMPLELQAQIPRTAPVELDRIEVVDPRGNAPPCRWL